MNYLSMKSLAAQITDLKIDGFAFKKLEHGDYGYNTVHGLLDGAISVEFRIPYYKDGDPNAIKDVAERINNDCDAVRIIARDVIPDRCVMTKYLDGEYLLYAEFGFEVDGTPINFYLPWGHHSKNKKAHALPIEYTAEQVASNIKNYVKRYTDNVKILLDTKKFEFVSYKLADPSECTDDYGNVVLLHDVVITGKAYGVVNSFTVKNFGRENMKRRLKQELKNFKRLARAKSKKRVLRTIDLRNYAYLAEAYEKYKKANSLFYNAHAKYSDSVKRANCEECKNYNGDKDLRTLNIRVDIDCEGRFSTCNLDCEHLDRAKKDMVNMAKKKAALDEITATVFVPAVIKFFKETNPRIILWQTGEVFGWEELFPDVDTVIKNHDVVALELLVSWGWTGLHVWEDDVISLDGNKVAEKRPELLRSGQDLKHNLANTRQGIDDGYFTVIDGKIVFTPEKYGDIAEFNRNVYSNTVRTAKTNTYRLERNYGIFKTEQDKYTVSARLAIYFAFLGNMEKAKFYKQKIAKLNPNKIKHDDNLERLLKAI